MTDFSLTDTNDRIAKASTFIDDLKKGMNSAILGQEELINKILIAMLSNGHILLEGVPGLAKTLMVKTLSSLIKTEFQRIQFTPDMLPADLLGTLIFNQKTGEFDTRKGPIFSNIILADEINRSPAKVQSALLEAMQERQVTIGENTYPLGEPFLVMATQNPIEQEGTYPLPEAQLDRFMFFVVLDYPTYEQELEIVKKTTVKNNVALNTILSANDILKFQDVITRLPVTDNVLKYAVGLVSKTRPNSSKATDIVKNYIEWGAGPRASQYMIMAAKCHAAINGKYSPDIEDVKAIAKPILMHRIVKNYKAEAEGITVEKIIESIL